MAATIKGTAHLFGVNGTYSNATILSVRRRKFSALEEQTQNETGVVIERRQDDNTTEITVTLRPRANFNEPATSAVLNIANVNYFLTSVEEDQTNNGFRQITLSGITSEGVSLS